MTVLMLLMPVLTAGIGFVLLTGLRSLGAVYCFQKGAPQDVVSAFITQGRCASCGYLIEGCPPHEPDGCTICPECGAAWRLSASHSQSTSKVG